MPTSPRSPLSFRTAGFPQYGWKVGLSDGAFPDRPLLKPAPGIRRLTPGLRPPFALLVVRIGNPRCVGPTTRWCAALEGGWPPPQGLSLRSGLFYPRPSPLIGPIRPTRRHSAISPTMRLIRDAFAVRERLGDPRAVPSFCCTFLPDMPSPMSPERSGTVLVQLSVPTWAFAKI